MSKGGNNRAYSEEWFLSRGYSKNHDGSFSPPPIKSSYIKSLGRQSDKEDMNIALSSIPVGHIIPKEKVNNTPDFQVKPVTEWFVQGYSVPSKKNSRQNFVRNGKQISIPSKQHAEYVKMTAMQYQVFGNEFKKAVEHHKLNYPLYIEFTFVRSTKHSFDYCNACQTVEDIIKGHWVPDDSADYIIPVFKPYEYNKENPGVRIKLLLK